MIATFWQYLPKKSYHCHSLTSYLFVAANTWPYSLFLFFALFIQQQKRSKKCNNMLKKRRKSFGPAGTPGTKGPRSRDLQGLQVLSCQDHGTFEVSRSCPVQSRDLGPLVPGGPGTSRDQIIFFLHVIVFFFFSCCITKEQKNEERKCATTYISK